jgi:hypothetical protein
MTIDRPVVLIQDIYPGSNFAHFLLDWIVRLALFAEHAPVPASECRFVLGGVPGEFHRIVLDAATSLLGLDDENFVFPTGATLIRGGSRLFYFSDQCSPCGHPAQLCRPEAVEWLNRLARAISGAAETGSAGRKLYISRSDAGQRLVANEAALFQALEARGFEFVRLADLPVPDQFALMGSAETVVASHGMGLTYLALHQERGLRVVELHNPYGGTDAYAFICKGKGFDYVPVIGSVVGAETAVRRAWWQQDLAVDPGAVLRALDIEHQAPTSASAFELQPRGRAWFPGCQSLPAVATAEVAPPLPDSVVLKHLRDAPERVADSNIGWWHIAGLQPAKSYTFSCWVYIPEEFCGSRVFLALGEPRETTADADVSRRAGWQFLSLEAGLPRGLTEIDLVLRLESEEETSMYSSAWSVFAEARSAT